ncbi:MAG: cation diffusion facilitator family transporter [Anaeroplasma sp.]
MINFLRKIFVKNYQDVKNQKVREGHGKLAAIVGIISNLFLFAFKILAGIISGSIAIIADSINNLSDMGSSVVTLVGFKLANMPADEEHPYGHERMEYIAGLIISIIIIFTGGSLFITSINKIINYQPEEINYISAYISMGILAVSILIKLWQSLFNRRIGKIIDSIALEATADDSRNDCITTGVILLGTIVMVICQLNNVVIPFSVDGILGILVSLFIMYSGFMLIKETMNPLIGNSVSKEYVSEILSYIKEYPIVLGYHDVVCHMYGPTKCFMTLHIEVDSKGDIITIHDSVDQIEKSVREKFGVELTIHMDPTEIGNPEVDELKDRIGKLLSDLDSNLHFHDLRLVKKLTLSTILFDVVVPYKFKMSNAELINYIEENINSGETKYAFIIDIDHNFIQN